MDGDGAQLEHAVGELGSEVLAGGLREQPQLGVLQRAQLRQRARWLGAEAAGLKYRRCEREVGERLVGRHGARLLDGARRLRRASAGEVLSRPGRTACV